MILSDELLQTFVLKLSRYILHENATFQIKAMKKYLPLNKKELAHKICSFRLIVAYTLKSVLLCISVGWTSFLLFELHVAVSHIKVKFMHNLLKLVPIYHLK